MPDRKGFRPFLQIPSMNGKISSMSNGFFNTRKIFYGASGLSLILGSSASGYSQQLIPVIRQVPDSSAVTQWNAFLRVENFGECSYVSLAQVAALFDGVLHWHPVAKQVDLNIRGHVISFSYGSRQARVDQHPVHLEGVTVKDSDGFWVPASFFAGAPFFRQMKERIDWPPPALPVVHRVSLPPVPAASPKEVVAKVPEVVTPKEIKAIRRIVIDPGHGGKDPGANGKGAHGVEEKAVNLIVAQELADALRDTQGYEVLLTRMDDTFIPLEEIEPKLANKYNADLFISLHCNASLSPKLKGFEIYFLSEKASDPHADAVARLENAPLALEGKSAPTPRQLENLLRSLVKNSNINESSALGSLIDHQVGNHLSEPALGVKQAGFYVLRGAEMPALLVEMAFLSNPDEEKLLQNASFRSELVQGLVAGISAYDEKKQKERKAS